MKAVQKVRKGGDPKHKPFYVALGAIITERREAKGLKHKQLAELTKFSRASICNIEAGRHRISLHDLISIADALDMSAVTLFRKVLNEVRPNRP